MRRTKREIIEDVLRVLREHPKGLMEWRVQRKANLNTERNRDALGLLVAFGFVERKEADKLYKAERVRLYFITDKGCELLQAIEETRRTLADIQVTP